MRTMLFRKPPGPNQDSASLDPVELFHLCAEDREDHDLWSEFLRRYSDRLKQYISNTLRQFTACQITSPQVSQEDLFQNVILRLVENDCAAMRRFSAATEKELLAYLAVICRSTVLDTVKHSSALKRRPASFIDSESLTTRIMASQGLLEHPGFEREILGRELMSVTRNTIKSISLSNRDRLVFEMHFFDGLSYGQIAQCEGINLSKAGVEKALKRIVDRVQNLVSPGKSQGTLQ